MISSSSPSSPRTIAVFDFDGTLIKGDSFWAFLGLVAGWPRTFLALAEALALWGLTSRIRETHSRPSCRTPPSGGVPASNFLLFKKTKLDAAQIFFRSAKRNEKKILRHDDREESLFDQKDIYTFIKSHLLHRLLKGRKLETLSAAIEKLRQKQKWNEAMVRKLNDHRAAGHHIVIASGGLNIYLPQLLQGVPFDALVCTQLEIKDGVITGAMLSGNCVRRRKAELLADYMEKNGPFAESWGYGNFPQDLPMLELVGYRIIV